MSGWYSPFLRAVPIRYVASRSSLIVLHHGVFPVPPADLRQGLHNITPTELHRQLLGLRRHFHFVSVDELADASTAKGLAALTFDDAYKSVIEHALPVLEDLGISATIFVNGATLEGAILWRDKVRMIINSGLVDELPQGDGLPRFHGPREFYLRTKEPTVSSALVQSRIDAFLEARTGIQPSARHSFDDLRWIVDHPLVSYGNHSHAHYVLSSLSVGEQYEQIDRTRRLLASIPGIRVSGLFAVPFGGERDFNKDTLAIVRELGYRGLLLSRQRLQFGGTMRGGLIVLDRFMPDAVPADDLVRWLFVRQWRDWCLPSSTT